MTIYILMAVPFLILALFGAVITELRDGARLALFPLFLALIALASFRVGTGTDYATYISIWRGIAPLDEALLTGTGYGYLEPGFRYFASALKLVSDSDRFFLFAMSSLALLPVYKGLTKFHGINLYLALALYFTIFYLPYALNAMRQAVAMGFFVLSLPYIKERKFYVVLAISSVAMSFHYSGVMILASYFVARQNHNVVLVALLGCFLSVLLYLSGAFFIVFELIFPSKAATYIEKFSQPTSLLQITTRTGIVLFLVSASVLMVKDEIFERFLVVYLIGFFCYIALLDQNMLATRLNMFFRVLEIVLLPMAIYRLKSYSNKSLAFLVILVIAAVLFAANLSNPDNLYRSVT